MAMPAKPKDPVPTEDGQGETDHDLAIAPPGALCRRRKMELDGFFAMR
jgi:hypothetical protein